MDENSICGNDAVLWLGECSKSVCDYVSDARFECISIILSLGSDSFDVTLTFKGTLNMRVLECTYSIVLCRL
ncbi:MAG: hypothetical protein FWH37_03365 [Candidatus Bathyarchaeota archaeon]|nr:hypothetical protein [Candidatus Termiticorpusculum sp.]